MSVTLFGLPLWVWSAICLALAATFAVFWPSAKAIGNLSNVRYLLLRWGHAAVWGLLGLALLLRAFDLPGVAIAAIGALVVYVAFLVALLRNP